MKKILKVRIVNEPVAFWKANYGKSKLALNFGILGHQWFNDFPHNLAQVVDLLIHELAHEYETDHLSENFYSTLTKLGADAVVLALEEPNVLGVSPSRR